MERHAADYEAGTKVVCAFERCMAEPPPCSECELGMACVRSLHRYCPECDDDQGCFGIVALCGSLIREEDCDIVDAADIVEDD